MNVTVPLTPTIILTGTIICSIVSFYYRNFARIFGIIRSFISIDIILFIYFFWGGGQFFKLVFKEYGLSLFRDQSFDFQDFLQTVFNKI